MSHWTLEHKVEICAVQELWNTSNKDYWLTSKNNLAAIYWNRGYSTNSCKTVYRGKHTITVKYKKFYLTSCYVSPNSDIHNGI